MKIDWKLKGFNLLKFSCNKDTVIHPETCSDVVLMGHDGEVSLTDWIKGSSQNIENSLGEWITNNLGSSISVNIPYNQITSTGISLGYFGADSTIEANKIYVPYGTNSEDVTPVYGVFCAGEGLSASTGTLNLDVATNNHLGGIKTGYSPVLGSNKFAVELDSNYRAFVNIGNIQATPLNYGWIWDSGIKKGFVGEDNFPSIPEHSYAFINEGFTFSSLGRDLESRYREVRLPSPYATSYIHPVGVSADGILYTYVEPQLYETFSSTSVNPGLVPIPNPGSRVSNYYLNALGNWDAIKPLSSGDHSTSSYYKIKGSGYSGTATKFLKEDGTWAIPTDTTYVVAQKTTEPKGLLLIPEDVTDDVTCTNIVIPSGSEDYLIPIVYNATGGKEGHGILLESIIKELCRKEDGQYVHSTLLTELKTALSQINI